MADGYPFIKINTPKVRSDEALARIQTTLHYIERIGRLRHGVMVPFGIEPSEMGPDVQLWQPWTHDERLYLKGVRTIFGHARLAVLENGALRVRDRHRSAPGKPEIDGFQFDKKTRDWEWDAQEFQAFSQRLEKLVFKRIQAYRRATVTCGTCGQSVDGREYLTCGHVEYADTLERKGGLFSKPAGGVVHNTIQIGCQDSMKDKIEDDGWKEMVITYEGLDQIISSLESFDKLASEYELKGTPIYADRPD